MNLGEKVEKLERDNKSLKTTLGGVATLAFISAIFTSTNAQAYPLVNIQNTTEYTVRGTVHYMSALCKNDNFVIAPGRFKRVRQKKKTHAIKKELLKCRREVIRNCRYPTRACLSPGYKNCKKKSRYVKKMFPGIWRAKSRGACLVTKITGSLSGRPKSLKRSRKSYGEKLAVVPYASTGTSYSKYKVSAFSGSYRIFSEQEFNKVTDTRPGKSPGFYFMNYTDWPIAYSIDQLGCLYYGIVPTGSKGKPGLRKVDTGAVWFTLRMHIQPDGKSPQSDWDCVEPVADLIGDVAMAIFTGGAATTAKLGAKAGVKAGIKAGIKKAAKGITLSMVKDYSKEQLGKLLKKSSSVVMYGQYAGYPWPTQCGTMPRYAITDGPKVFLDRTGNAYIGQNVPFKVKKTNTCGNKMMSSSSTQVTGEVGVFKKAKQPKKKKSSVFKKAQRKKKKKRARRISTASKKIKWFKFKGSLRNAFIGGGRPANKKRRLKRHKYAVCRGSYKKGIHPGKVHRGKCYIGYGGKEIVLRSFEVLSKRGRGNKFTWVKLRQARGKRKVIGGKEKNRSLAICRGRYKGGVHPGKLIRKKCNFGYWGKEIVLRKFEVLIKK